MMNYNEFKDYIVKALKEVFENAEINLNTVTKNNGLTLDGVTILLPNSNIAPTIYLNGYYNDYLDGRDLEDIVNVIIELYKKNASDKNFDVSFFTMWDRVKEHIVFNLVNYERNIELLSQIPHVKFLDLAIIFKVLLPNISDSSESATILIRNEHLKFWNKSADELYEVAKKNTPETLEVKYKNLFSMLGEMFDEEMLDDVDELPMFVLTNSKNLNGSGCILYENVLKRISEKLDSNLFILPSSVHEVILVPADDMERKLELKAMVLEVNATMVSSDEILSDEVYYYDREKDEVVM